MTEEDFKKLQEQWAKEDRQIELEMLKRGFQYKVVYWVHPKSGGDDTQHVVFCRSRPPEQLLRKWLVKSAIKNDYTITEIRGE